MNASSRVTVRMGGLMAMKPQAQVWVPGLRSPLLTVVGTELGLWSAPRKVAVTDS